MKEFEFWGWSLTPERPAITHTVRERQQVHHVELEAGNVRNRPVAQDSAGPALAVEHRPETGFIQSQPLSMRDGGADAGGAGAAITFEGWVMPSPVRGPVRGPMGGSGFNTPFSATFARGDIVHVFGANGVGKSTFLRSLRDRRAAKGRVTVHGAAPVLLQSREQVCHEAMSVRALAGAAGVADLAGWGLEGQARVSVRALSRGEKTRFMLMLAEHLDPEVLLLDEPSLGLDFEGIALLRAFLARRQARERLSVLATHEINLIAETGGRVFLMSRQTGGAGLSTLSEDAGGLIEAEIRMKGEIMRVEGSPLRVAGLLSRLAMDAAMRGDE